ncbi:MAG: hypothetical protein J1G06_06795 [Oscillospiraceae bacterium]|nr:hypothetical protein [Oscillospiraceae bacterium]
MNEENLKNESDAAEENDGVVTPEDIAALETADGSIAPEEIAPDADEEGKKSSVFAGAPKESGIYISDDSEADPENKVTPGLSPKIIIAVAAGITIIAAIVVLLLTGVIGGNRIGKHNNYNSMYIDIDGMTAGELADARGMEFDEFIEYFGLPKDMTEDTNTNAVQNMIPLKRYIEIFGGGFYTLDTMKEEMGWDDSVTEDMTLGAALDKTTLRYYVGEEQFDMFKEYYNLGDEVTLDTTWGEIRNTVEKQTKEENDKRKAEEDAAKKEAEEAEQKSGEDGSKDNSDKE